jgi:hypothetical protein
MQSVTRPLFELSARTRVAAPPEAVYAVVSDLTRSAEWSPECVGGEWTSGEPGTPGAVFRGENHRSTEVVSWAPVVRGTWFTESEVVYAEPGRAFAWSMRNSAGEKQESVWSYDIHPAASGGSELVHRFRMGSPTEGIRGITAEMDDAARERFFTQWGDKVAADMQLTVERIRQVVETTGKGS